MSFPYPYHYAAPSPYSLLVPVYPQCGRTLRGPEAARTLC